MSNAFVPHPETGKDFYGSVPEIRFGGYLFDAGDICLKRGIHKHGKGGFGVAHIWERHRVELRSFDVFREDDVPLYVASIVKPRARIYCEFNHLGGNHRLTVLRSRTGVAILELKRMRGGKSFYSVVTAYPKMNADGTQIGTVR